MQTGGSQLALTRSHVPLFVFHPTCPILRFIFSHTFHLHVHFMFYLVSSFCLVPMSVHS